jgi:iron complex transport system ATP-binding protein
MTRVFQLHNVSFAYRSSPVLRGISTDFNAGDFVVIVGPNGAGKSTLLKLMAGLLRGYQGSIEFSGKSLSQWKPRELARSIAFVPQETQMVFPFTVGEIVMMGRLPHSAVAGILRRSAQ